MAKHDPMWSHKHDDFQWFSAANCSITRWKWDDFCLVAGFGWWRFGGRGRWQRLLAMQYGWALGAYGWYRWLMILWWLLFKTARNLLVQCCSAGHSGHPVELPHVRGPDLLSERHGQNSPSMMLWTGGSDLNGSDLAHADVDVCLILSPERTQFSQQSVPGSRREPRWIGWILPSGND